ncbi:MAG: PD-(D/E)XK nuclease family protein [Anaerolineales bacterium]|nr:PD-(D/E)XK nuclease family protein [Anaerolineales bacterium]
MSSSWKLSPSDLTFLWDECPRCFYLKVVHGINRPWGAFPKIFNRIDKLMKAHFEGKPASQISPMLPEGIVRFGEKWVTSEPIQLPGHTATCFIKGKFDVVLEFHDHSYGVVDFKTSEAKPEHIRFYSRQLHAYAYALENPASGKLSLQPINRLGLLCVEPVEMDQVGKDQLAYVGNATWLECPKDNQGFMKFLDQVITLLELPSPPEPNPKCGWCQYREAARDHGL